MENWLIVAAIAVGLCLLWLLTQRWFWTIGLFVGTLASAFACIASIIHFQILGALGFFFLACILGALNAAIASE